MARPTSWPGARCSGRSPTTSSTSARWRAARWRAHPSPEQVRAHCPSDRSTRGQGHLDASQSFTSMRSPTFRSRKKRLGGRPELVDQTVGLSHAEAAPARLHLHHLALRILRGHHPAHRIARRLAPPDRHAHPQGQRGHDQRSDRHPGHGHDPRPTRGITRASTCLILILVSRSPKDDVRIIELN